MIDPAFSHRLRLARARARALCLAACLLWLGGCATTGYYNITDFNTVVIDAGHGGRDGGTSARLGRRGTRVQEKDLTLDVARRLEGKLREAGFRVVMTRRSDRFVPLDDRADIGNRRHKSVFVSIHFNDTRRRRVHGVEVYHNRRGTWQLAARIERSLASMRGGEERGVKTAGYRVLRKSRGPALLVECGFLSNPTEAARCADPEWREQLATRLARAIIAQRQP